MKKLFLIIFFIFLELKGWSQKRQVDSLINYIGNSKVDSLKFEAMCKLALAYKDSNLTKTKLHLQQVVAQSRKSSWPQGEFLAYDYASYIFNEKTLYDTSLYLSQKAIEGFKRYKMWKELAKAYKYVGIRQSYYLQDFKTAKKYLDSAELVYKKIGNQAGVWDTQKYIATNYNYLGNISKSSQIYESLLIVFKKKPGELNDVKDLLANNYIAINEFDKAFTLYSQTSQYYKTQNNHLRYAYSVGILGHLYYKKKNFKTAEINLLTSYQILKKENQLWNLQDVCRYLGMLYTDTKHYAKAKKYLDETLQITLSLKDFVAVSRAYSAIERYYFSLGKMEMGDYYSNLSGEIRDSLYTSENNRLLADYEIKYKTAEKEAKLKEAQLEIAQKHNWIISLSLVFLGILVSGGLLWNITNLKTKASETEKLKNLEIENQKKLLSTKEIERQRIAKELHDSVGSQLTVVSTSLDNAFYLFENHKLNPEKLENISAEVRLAAQSLRDTIWATYSSEISIADLRSRIQEFVKKFTDENSFKVEINIWGDEVVLTPIEGLNLFRIVQEAINNTQKHAEASLVKINGDFSENNYKLEIADNGKGFELQLNEVTESYGLKNMKSRAVEIGGMLVIESNFYAGSKIIFKK
jgi:signal transduction histidine kinase